MDETYFQLAKDCEDDIRSGQLPRVSRRLAKLNLAKVPRTHRLPLANICRRAGLYSIGLRLLGAIVLGKEGIAETEATPPEQAEYGALLLRCGAVTEAIERLQDVDASQAPDAHLFTAFARLSLWEFDAAAHSLKNYLASPIADYNRLVGQTNLAFALVSGEHMEEALQLLELALASANQGGHSRLTSNCLALKARALIQMGRLEEAGRELQKSRDILGSANTVDAFFITRWQLTLDALAKGDHAPLDELKRLARERGDWDALRAADFYSLQISFRQEQFDHLLFGTPFPGYRAYIRQKLGRDASGSQYLFGTSNGSRLSLADGKIDGAEEDGPKKGRKTHQFIELLLRDFYRPLNVGGIFCELFPGEHFDPLHSPGRVYQVIRRARAWLESAAIPATIDENNGFYSARVSGEFAFVVPLERESTELFSLHLKQIQEVFAQGETFGSRDVRERLGLSLRTVQRVLSWSVENARVERLGSSPSTTRYRFLTARRPQLKAA